MAIEHSALTGAQLHEPKGAASAAAGTVYVANGSGSGSWVNPLNNVKNLNVFSQDKSMTDVGTASSVYFNVPVNSELTKLNVILYGTIDVNTVMTIHINGVLFAQSLTLVAAGSSEGQKQTLLITTSNSLPAGSIVKVTSDGAATTTTRADIQLEFEATG